MTPSIGEADSTLFSFDVSEFQTINAHINSELGLSSSSDSVTFVSADLIYPDLTVVQISDTSSFVVPAYQVDSATSFQANVKLHFTLNGNTQSEIVSEIHVTQAPYVIHNGCGCR